MKVEIEAATYISELEVEATGWRQRTQDHHIMTQHPPVECGRPARRGFRWGGWVGRGSTSTQSVMRKLHI